MDTHRHVNQVYRAITAGLSPQRTEIFLRSADGEGFVMEEVESSWNVMAHGDARERKWRGNWRMEWVASPLHTISEHGESSITTTDSHTSAASSRQNWRPRRFRWTRPFRQKTKSGFCAYAITFQTRSTNGGGLSPRTMVFPVSIMFHAHYCNHLPPRRHTFGKLESR